MEAKYSSETLIDFQQVIYGVITQKIEFFKRNLSAVTVGTVSAFFMVCYMN
jgi:hypothetical protein